MKFLKKVLAFFDGIYYAIQASFKWLVGQAVKTPPSHGGIRGSIPLRAVDYFRIAQPWKTEHIDIYAPLFHVEHLAKASRRRSLRLVRTVPGHLMNYTIIERKRDRAWEQTTIIP